MATRTSNFALGFTLLEMLVSIGIFSIVIVSSISILLSISAGEAKSHSNQIIQDNVRYTVELMTKELRQAGTYTPGSCSGSQCQTLSFQSVSGVNVLYCLDNGVVRRATGAEVCQSGAPLTSNEIQVTRLFFYVVGSQAGPLDGQPRVTIVLEAHTTSPKVAQATSFNLQTTITRRLRDF